MCPFIWLTLILSWLVAVLELCAGFTVVFPKTIAVRETEYTFVPFKVQNDPKDLGRTFEYQVQVTDEKIAQVAWNKTLTVRNDLVSTVNFNDNFTLKGVFLGHTQVYFVRHETKKAKQSGKLDYLEHSNSAEVLVKRKSSILSKLFIIAVATLVSINYINMGCAMDVKVIKSVLKRPVAPAIGFASQYLFMPVISYFVGYYLLSDEQNYLWLGLFTFGCSPAGGASNMWTVLLKGNLDLSITMTFISTVASTFMLPIWMYALGKNIFEGTATTVPFSNVLGTLMSMILFLGIGLAIQKYLPKVAKVCKRILAPFSICMIIFIITFGTYSNLYMFKLMDTKIILSAAITVWCGFLVGLITSSLLNLPMADRIAISIETGVQNTGIAIVLLGLSLSEPSNDIASVVPVAASIVTPIPLTVAMIVGKLRARFNKNRDSLQVEKANGFEPVRSVSNNSCSALLKCSSNVNGSANNGV
ncbi:P3 protein [Halotydeus destructor]|nr:P3 protein [Halotydeus destructor]